jgi:DNA-binding NarL/FixJ family response regulator
LRYVGHAADVAAALAELSVLAPHVVLVRVDSKTTDVRELIRRIRLAAPSAAIVMKMVDDTPWLIKDGLHEGAAGAVMRGVTSKALEMCLQSVGGGSYWIDGDVWKQMLTSPERPKMHELKPKSELRGTEPYSLTRREAEILRLVAEGQSNAEIGFTLGIGRETVKTHLRKVMTKLGARTRTEAAIYATRAAESAV